MSRSGYIDDMEDQWAFIRYRGAVTSAMRGKRGQTLFTDILKALDALPDKKLIANSLQAPTGEYCTLGAVGAMRGVNMANLDPDNIERVARVFGISEALAREVVYHNDEAAIHPESPHRRFERMRSWAIRNLHGDLPSEPYQAQSKDAGI